MVLFAMITRVSDGMPLSASTDLDMHFELKESKRLAKSLARKANQYPTRCAMQCGNHMIYFVKAVGVCFLAVCNGTYPAVLVFCFLEELQREFVITFQSQDVQRAKRPYSFIEFDSFIQKTKQRYNNTRTLTSRLNLSEMSEDLHNNPPFQISQSELGPENNTDVKTYKTGGPTRRLEPLTWKSLTACALAGICGLLNFLRCFPFLNVIVLDDEASATWFSAVGFLLAGVLNCCQLLLLLFSVRWRMPLARILFGLLLFLIYLLRGLRNIWQILFHLTVAAFVLYQTAKRQLQAKPPDYNV